MEIIINLFNSYILSVIRYSLWLVQKRNFYEEKKKFKNKRTIYYLWKPFKYLHFLLLCSFIICTFSIFIWSHTDRIAWHLLIIFFPQILPLIEKVGQLTNWHGWRNINFLTMLVAFGVQISWIFLFCFQCRRI